MGDGIAVIGMRCLAVLGVLVGLSSPAAAYSDHNLYEVPAIEGGADSRYFTGSKADGYSCSVCHTGGTSDDFTVEGLPQAVVAGQSYDLVIRWRDRVMPHGLHVELTTPSGRPAVTTLPDAMQPEESRCADLAGHPSAIYVLDRGVRRIVGVEPCGASRVDINFTAGSEPIELAIGGVRGNKNDAPTGDAVFERRVVLEPTAATSTGCAAGHGDLGWALLVLIGLSVRRRPGR